MTNPHGLASHVSVPQKFKEMRRSPNWKGGTYKIGKYIMQICHGHPFANKSGYVAQHRLVMEKFLGRYLDSYEIVHHIDNNASNNLIDNLELCSTAAHSSYHHNGRKKQTQIESNCHPYLLIKRKCLYCKQYDFRHNLFISSINRTAYHRKCKGEYEKMRKLTKASASQMPE